MQARELIDRLSLLPHPEGGWYREIYRSRERVQTRRGLRSALTTIHYLLEQQQLSRWHVVESAEIWHFYDGAPLELFEYVPATRHLARHVLGHVREGNESVVVVEAGVWQAARSRGELSLLGCTVGPGFEFEDFRFVTALASHQAHFTGELAGLAHLLWRFSFRIDRNIVAAGIFKMSQPSPDRESLQALLARVHERLNEAGSVDSGSRELLSQVMGDIERALQPGSNSPGNANPGSSAVAAAAEAHTPRLEALAVQFEADHPSLSAALNGLVDLLGKAGI
jgi:uncharacterized protein